MSKRKRTRNDHASGTPQCTCKIFKAQQPGLTFYVGRVALGNVQRERQDREQSRLMESSE